MEMTEEEKTKRNQLLIFWGRLVVWVLLAVVAPIVYVAVEYGLFKPQDGTTKSLSGWGIIAIVVAFAMVVAALKTVVAGLPKGHIARQCVSGFIPIVVLVAVLFALKTLENYLDELEHLLVFLIIVEGAAVPINPLPKWAFDHNVEFFTGKATEAIKNALSSFFTKK